MAPALFAWNIAPTKVLEHITTHWNYLILFQPWLIPNFLIFIRLPIVQGGTFAFITPTFAILSLPKWACPTAEGQFSCILLDANRGETGLRPSKRGQLKTKSPWKNGYGFVFKTLFKTNCFTWHLFSLNLTSTTPRPRFLDPVFLASGIFWQTRNFKKLEILK